MASPGNTRNAPWNWNEPVVGANGKATPQFIYWLQQQLKIGELANEAVPQGRRVDTGAGLSGGGDLSQDRTLTLDANINNLNDVDTVTTPPIDGQALLWDSLAGEWTPGDVATSGGVDVDEDGSSVVSAATVLNFSGDGVSVTDAGSGQADIVIAGGPDPTPPPPSPVLSFWSKSAVGTGVSQTILLPVIVDTPKHVLVFVNGLAYETNEYTVSGNSLTLTTNASGDSIEIRGIDLESASQGDEFMATAPTIVQYATLRSDAYSVDVPLTSTATPGNTLVLVVTGQNYFKTASDGMVTLEAFVGNYYDAANQGAQALMKVVEAGETIDKITVSDNGGWKNMVLFELEGTVDLFRFQFTKIRYGSTSGDFTLYQPYAGSMLAVVGLEVDGGVTPSYDGDEIPLGEETFGASGNHWGYTNWFNQSSPIHYPFTTSGGPGEFIAGIFWFGKSS